MDAHELLAYEPPYPNCYGIYRSLQGEICCPAAITANPTSRQSICLSATYDTEKNGSKMREYATMICLDDKSMVPIGEPGQHVSTGVRAHNKSMIPVGATLAALDHDFHIHGAIPSVLFQVNIPENESDSFYDGILHVTVKDKVFAPSSALRHSTETVKILRGIEDLCTDDIHLVTPVLFIFTDGGPDHRSTYWSVKLAYVLLFIALDLDLLVTARTAPSNSYANPAKRCMSLLNMALQNVSLARQEMEESAEFKVRSLSTMKKMRETAHKQPLLQEALTSSLEPVIALLKQRFSRLRLHEEDVLVHDAATEDDMSELARLLSIFDEHDCPVTLKELQKESGLKKYPRLADFIQQHSHCRHYSFQIQKCSRDNCAYCVMSPRHLPEDVQLGWLPDCVLDDDSTSLYKDFDKVFGTATDDQARPGLKAKDSPTENDKKNKGTLVAGVLVNFPPICYYCGDIDDFHMGPDIEQLLEQYGIVRPLCITCHLSGKQAFVRNSTKVGNK